VVLYKYVSFKTALDIIENNSIAFSCIEDLNDPFECTALGFSDGEMSASMVTNAYRNRFSRNYALLSLTREPLNPLMWAHYGDSHQGVAIGIDVEKAGLTCTQSSIIPAQYGEVIYTASKPKSVNFENSTEELMNIGKDATCFNSDFYNITKRAFLYKSSEWSYEEEVRVVKRLVDSPYGYDSEGGAFSNVSGDWIQKNPKCLGRPIYCLQLPKDSIVNVYLGRHVYKNISRTKITTESEFANFKEICRGRGIALNRCEPDVHSWKLNETKV
jgi:hypothetical protein